MSPSSVVIGLDGAGWHLLQPMMDAGVMPNLASLTQRGARGTLRSTVPTYTPPAWTSAVTGVNPGRHGIYGFFSTNAQSPRQELVHAGAIKAAPLWEMANAQGATAGIYNLPLTYPPQSFEGWMVSGMMTPEHGEHRLTNFARPTEVEKAILELIPDYVVDVSANWATDWRSDALCERVLRSLEQRLVALETLLERHPTDLVFTVLEAPDRLQHVYYRYLDPADDMYESEAGKRLRPRILECFAAMDRITGLLAGAAGEGGVIVCSDHGFTAWDVSLHTNALLERWGYFKLRPGARLMQTRAARGVIPAARRVLSAKAARAAKTKAFAAVDWSRTKAFASPVPQQGIYVNLEGREPYGIVPPTDLETLKDEIAGRLLALRGPDGGPVTDRVYRAEEVFSGEHLDGAPDLLPVLRDHRFELDDEIFHRAPFTDQSHLPRGVHHPDGIVVVAGPGVRPGAEVKGTVWDVTPTMLYQTGLAVPEGLDGEVMLGAFEPDHLNGTPVRRIAAQSRAGGEETSPYSADEEAAIEESLRGLGYL